jgi:bla regulator protein BlaR1
MIAQLTNHLWQSTLFAVVAGLLTVALRKNRAHVRFWLWFSASLKFFVPFALLMSLGSHLEWAPARKIATQIAPPAVSFTMEQITQPFPTLPITPSTRGTLDWVPVAILGVWTVGFTIIALARFRAWLRVRKPVGQTIVFCGLSSCPIRSVPGLLEPGVIGVFRPILLLPAGIEERLTPPQLEAVLAHELCHIRRRDNLFASIHMIVEAIFWFHPLVWWIGARLVEERERACDEEVLHLGSELLVYAEGILNVCKLYVELPLVCVSGVTGSDIKKRIEAIMTNRRVLRLTFAKKVTLAAAGIAALAVPIVVGVLNAPRVRAQTAPASLSKFEVASIKPCKVGDFGGGGGRKGNTKTGGGGRSSSPGRLSTMCDTVENLIRSAYIMCASGSCVRDPSSPSVEGGPSWIQSDRYQINARAEGSPSEGMMIGPIMQTLLEDRFHLKIHRESREVPIYALTVAKDGPKLKPFQEGTCIPHDLASPMLTPEQRSQNNCFGPGIRLRGPNLGLEATGTNLDSVSKLLYIILDRPVINQTAITGRFDINIEFARPEGTPVFRPAGEPSSPPTPPADSDEPPGPSIFSVMEKQLGLKLEPARGPRDFYVIDHVERPSGN